jgi:hypothetical protein
MQENDGRVGLLGHWWLLVTQRFDGIEPGGSP